MAIFNRSKPSPPSASTATPDAIEPTAVVVEAATTEKDQISESDKNAVEEPEVIKNEKKKPEAGLGNYFVMFWHSKLPQCRVNILEACSRIWKLSGYGPYGRIMSRFNRCRRWHASYVYCFG